MSRTHIADAAPQYHQDLSEVPFHTFTRHLGVELFCLSSAMFVPRNGHNKQGRYTRQKGRPVCSVAALHPTVPSGHSHAAERSRVYVLPLDHTGSLSDRSVLPQIRISVHELVCGHCSIPSGDGLAYTCI